MAAGIVFHRQQREWAGRIENLIRDMLMRPFVAQYRDDRLMVVFPTRDIDAGGLARLRIATVCRNQQRRAEFAAVLKRNHYVMIAAIDRGDSRFPKQPDVLSRVRARVK